MSGVTFLTGASSGLGAALAPRLAADGDKLVLTARRLDALESVAAQVRAAGGTALPLALDVTDGAAVAAAVRRAEAELGPIDTLIANAGIGDYTPAETFKAADVMRIFGTNVFGVSHCIEAVLPGMLERKAGHIVGVSSLAAYRGLPASGAYAASKAALTNLLESLRIELKPLGIDVTTLAPGFVKTPMTARNRFPMPFIMELEDAVSCMYEAIREKRTYAAFPWQLATVVRSAKVIPDSLYDRVMGKRKAVKD